MIFPCIPSAAIILFHRKLPLVGWSDGSSAKRLGWQPKIDYPWFCFIGSLVQPLFHPHGRQQYIYYNGVLGCNVSGNSKIFCLVLLVFSKWKDSREVPKCFVGPSEHSRFGKSSPLFLLTHFNIPCIHRSRFSKSCPTKMLGDQELGLWLVGRVLAYKHAWALALIPGTTETGHGGECQ